MEPVQRSLPFGLVVPGPDAFRVVSVDSGGGRWTKNMPLG